MKKLNKMKTGWKVFFALLTFTALVGIIFFSQLMHLYQLITLFDEGKVVDNFMNMDEIFDTRAVHQKGDVYELNRVNGELPETYSYQGEERNVQELLEETWTTGLIVLKDDNIVYEDYYLGNTEDTKFNVWSVSKSIVSALMGIAVEDGYINDIEDPVTEYVPFLEDTGYEGVSIKDVLQMSSGINFKEEDYGAYFSDINRLFLAMTFNISTDNFVASLEREREPGTYNQYASTDTQVLAMVLREATGQNLSSFMEENLWGKVGMEADAYWLLDNNGMELAFGGLNAVLRDQARFGLLFLKDGILNGKKIIPPEWVEASVTPDEPHLMPGRDDSDHDDLWGYGYQWWIPGDTTEDYLAIGIYNQYIWIHPEKNVVIAKNSAYPEYNDDGEQKTSETVAMFNSIARSIADSE